MIEKDIFGKICLVGELRNIKLSVSFEDWELSKKIVNTQRFILARKRILKNKSFLVFDLYLQRIALLRVLVTLCRCFKEQDNNHCIEARLDIRSLTLVADASKAIAWCHSMSLKSRYCRLQRMSWFKELLTSSCLRGSEYTALNTYSNGSHNWNGWWKCKCTFST